MKSTGLRLGRRGLIVAAIAFASLGFASAAGAATYTVNDNRDLAQSSTAASGACVSTASTCTLRTAIQAANENGGSNTINVPAGTYPISSSNSGSTNPNCPGATNSADESTGDLKVDDCNNSTAITVVGAGSGSTVINAQGNDRIFTLYPNGVLAVQNVTLENGLTNSSSKDFQHDDGGAIDSSGHLSASGVTFTGNTATAGGGAIEAEDTSGSTVSVTGSVFQNNSGGDGGGAIADISPNDVSVSFSLFQANTAATGGAIAGCNVTVDSTNCPNPSGAAALTLNFDDFVQNVASDIGGGSLGWAGQGAVNITNSLFTQNQATNGVGGGIGNEGTANFNISNTSFDGNSSSGDGGALFDGGFPGFGSNGMNLTQDRFTDNQSSQDGGALLLASTTGTAGTVITSSEFDGNQANNTGHGGAILWESLPLQLKGDSFVLNTAFHGAALYSEATPVTGGVLLVADSTMSRNTATDVGGAIYNDGDAAATFFNDTIAFNNAPAGAGGGVFDFATYRSNGTGSGGFGVENTTIAENSGGDCGGTRLGAGSSFDVGNNNDSDQTCFGGVGGPNDKTGVNPLLSNPANNGGPAAGGPGDTETIQTDAEQSGSPTVDAGNNNGCPPVDERGVSRPQGAACDIGAFEFGASPLTSTSTATTGVTTTSSQTSTVTSTTTAHKHKAKKCKPGKVRKHGRCVAKHRKHRHHHKKKKKK